MIEYIKNNSSKKVGKFSTYFVIKNDVIYLTNNQNFENNLKNCYYVKKLGSNTHPKLYVSQKQNYEWINKDIILHSYDNLTNLICKRGDNLICISGFSKSLMAEFIRMTNKTKGQNIIFLKSTDKLYNEKDLLTKKLIKTKNISRNKM